ncbi:MAG TPA: hypothetical protein VK809_06335 [Bacteroidia bacterium]|jgi:hypothetical protein|nr:hypothetical protein [Bacteroidia bacterium]
MSRLKNFNTLFLLLLVNFSHAQSWRNHLSNNQKLVTISNIKADNTDSVANDSLLYYKSGYGSILHDLIIWNPDFQKKPVYLNGTLIHSRGLSIDLCRFYDEDDFPFIPDTNNEEVRIAFPKGFSLTNSTFSKEIPIRYIKARTKAATININADTSKEIYIDDCEFNLLNVMNNTDSDEINLGYLKSDAAVIAFNKFSASQTDLYIAYSTFFIGCSILENTCQKVTFEHDTIKGALNVQFTNRLANENERSKRKTIAFKNSYINAPSIFIVDDSFCTSKLIFNNCSFGSATTMFNLKVDTVIFNNCTDIPSPLFLTADSSKKYIYIELINSNVINIRFDYTEKFKLFFDKGISEETKNNTYQSLFAKYKAEGKPQNIEKIDIEYKRYQYKQNWAMYPIWLLDYIWWRYGYSKWLVIAWVLIFLIVFFVFNYRNWEGMRKIYGVFDKKDLSLIGTDQNNHHLRKKIIFVLIFTSFIFFSLRIDFDKLKYASNKYLVVFFTQYIVGLICLFFLVNAIFKLG